MNSSSTVPVQFYTSNQLVSDLRIPIRMAGIVSIIAGPIIILMSLVAPASEAARHGVPTLILALGTAAAFVGAYFLMAAGSAFVVFLLRPLRRTWIGWALTGSIVILACYGALLTVLLVFFDPVGRWFFTLKGGAAPDPKEFAWFATWAFGPIAALIGAAAGLYWRDNPS